MIALLLGSFNPIHNGHLAIAKHVIDKGLASEVWFIVSPQNPLKSASELAPFENRVEMVRLAVKGIEKMQVNTIEATLPYPSYTVNTLRELHKLYPRKEFTILAGSDIREQLSKWREPQEVQRLAKFLIYPRGLHRDNCSPEMADAELIDISSTECREGLYPLNEKVEKALNPSVLEYIYKNNLYNYMKTISDFDRLIAQDHKNPELYFERGRLHFQGSNFGMALNDFNEVLRLDSEHEKARQMRTMIEEILAFRHTDIYNP